MPLDTAWVHFVRRVVPFGSLEQLLALLFAPFGSHFGAISNPSGSLLPPFVYPQLPFWSPWQSLGALWVPMWLPLAFILAPLATPRYTRLHFGSP